MICCRKDDSLSWEDHLQTGTSCRLLWHDHNHVIEISFLNLRCVNEIFHLKLDLIFEIFGWTTKDVFSPHKSPISFSSTPNICVCCSFQWIFKTMYVHTYIVRIDKIHNMFNHHFIHLCTMMHIFPSAFLSLSWFVYVTICLCLFLFYSSHSFTQLPFFNHSTQTKTLSFSSIKDSCMVY